MLLAKWVFRVAGVYGLAVLTPMFFMERQLAPHAAHPVFFYAWVCTNLVWQVLFLVLSADPARYRAFMPICALQKVAAVIAIPWLFVVGRVGGMWLGAAVVDLLWVGLFMAAYRGTMGGVSRSDGA
jgi:hypothetical protein